MRAVLFDLDNTLIDRDRAFIECVNLATGDPAARAELRQLDQGGRGDRGLLFAAWKRHTSEVMNQARFGNLVASRISPDLALLEALSTLGTHCKIGIITNGGGDTQRQKLRAAGLDSIFPASHIWISGETGCAKPSPEIFLLASRTLNIRPEGCLFVGDNENDDITGATAARMHAHRIDNVLTASRLQSLLQEEHLA